MSSETSEWIDSDSPFKPIETWGSEMIRAAVWGSLAVVGVLSLLIPIFVITAVGIVVGQGLGISGELLEVLGVLSFILGFVFDAGFVFYFMEA